MATKVHRSIGNGFRDFGFAPVEAENLRIRSELMIQIRRLIEERKLTQAAAAKLFGVTQPRVSDLVATVARGLSVPVPRHQARSLA